MDTEERGRLKRLAELRFQNLESALKRVVRAKENYKGELQKLDSKTYAPEYMASEAGGLRAAYDTARLTAFEDVKGKLTDLQEGLEELHSSLDLENPAWQNALRLIEMGGKELDGDTIRKINEGFAFDQPALRALQKIYRARGIVYDGSLDAQIYEIEGSFAKLHGLAREALVQDRPINTFAAAVNRVAKLEGFVFDGTPDPVELEEALRAGAGLPSEEASILSGLQATTGRNI
jgi:hypothetical protein